MISLYIMNWLTYRENLPKINMQVGRSRKIPSKMGPIIDTPHPPEYE